MTIKEQLKKLEAGFNDDSKVSKPRLGAMLATLAAELEDDAVEVTAEDLSALSPEGRKLAAMGMVALMSVSLQKVD